MKYKKNKENSSYWIITYIVFLIIIMAFIFIQSAFPATVSREESRVVVKFLRDLFGWSPDNAAFIVRKIGHFLEYLVMGLALGLAAGNVRKRRQLAYWISWIGGTLFAVTDEIHQYFVPGRSCEFRDVVIDSCGVALGVIVIRLLKGSRQHNE